MFYLVTSYFEELCVSGQNGIKLAQHGGDFGRRVTASLAVASTEGQLGLQIILEVCWLRDATEPCFATFDKG